MTANLDFSYINDIAGGEKEPFFNLLRIVSKNLNEYPPQIELAFQEQEWEDLRKLSHKFKSCTAYLSFPELNDILVELEYAKENDMADEDIASRISKMKDYSLITQEQVTNKLAEMMR